MPQLIPGQRESQLTERTRSLEVRWVFPGSLESEVPAWLARFPGELEVREDTYLLDPHLRGLSVKIRAGRALEVKMYQGSPGVLEVAGRALGRMESWQKWSFPCEQLRREDAGPASWVPVHKRRRVSRFSLADGSAACAVEFTAVRARERNWWTVGFEATGPDNLLRGELEAAAALVFTWPAPDLAKFGPHESRSYAAWLRDAV
ncbi:MAG TPA: hypothetical protein VF223_13760 [Trebonia sp.]